MDLIEGEWTTETLGCYGYGVYEKVSSWRVGGGSLQVSQVRRYATKLEKLEGEALLQTSNF